MGTVYHAEQIHPFHRHVAIKLLHHWQGGGNVLARFQIEQQALARMEHPSIAQVFDAGVDRLGRPYFVMELVRGASITEFCERQHLPMRERIRLFLDVCSAVQHAHERGVIHRDIKPSNIMVAEQAMTAMPKIIDFGISKALDVSGGADLTRDGCAIGTLEYMSPEQVLGHSEIDARTDVYSLGMVLYLLAAGCLPYDLRGKSVWEASRIIAGDRPLPDRQLRKQVPRDIETILMKCLERDRDRRYTSAASLRDDLLRWLEARPVLARRPGPAMKALRFAKRQRVTLITMFAAVILVVGIIEATRWDQRRSRDFDQIGWALRQASEKGVPPENVQPTWPQLIKRLHRAVRTNPNGPLAVQAMRAAVQIKADLPSFGLLSEPAVLMLRSEPEFDAGRDFLCLVDVQVSWNGEPWRTIGTAGLRWASGAEGWASYTGGGGLPIDSIVPREKLTAGPHRLELRGELTFWDSARNSIEWKDLLPSDSGSGEQWNLLTGPMTPQGKPLMRESRELASLNITLFDSYPDDFPRRVVESETTGPVESWFHPARVLLIRALLPPGPGTAFSVRFPPSGRVVGTIPPGADRDGGFPAGIRIDFLTGKTRRPAIPIAARGRLWIDENTQAVAEFDLTFGFDQLWLDGPESHYSATWVQGNDNYSTVIGLFSSLDSDGPLPRAQVALPKDGEYRGRVEFVPSREVALETRRFDRYFGRTISTPVAVEITTVPGDLVPNGQESD